MSDDDDQAALALIAAGDPTLVIEAIIHASLGPVAPSWLEPTAVALTLAADQEVRRAGLLALGHLAIRFHRLENPDAARLAVARLATEPDLAGTAEDVGMDLDIGLR